MKSNRASLTALIAFTGICAAVPIAVAQSSARPDANGVSVTGKVSCTKFGRGTVTARKGMSVAQTIFYCATFQGGDYSLVSGNKIYRLTGDKNLLAKMAGQTVNVGGQMVPEPEDVSAAVLMGTVAVSQVVPSKE
jgi:hypothetical protein